MKATKKYISFIVCICILLSSSAFSFAAEYDAGTKAADALYELGLFKGTGTNQDGTPIYSLDKAPTRAQAIIMLVRLLGKEEEALDGNWEIPFTDVSGTSAKYIGYAYTNGLTNGTSATTFSGSKLINANQYITFVLRALGYSSSEDFKVSTAIEFAKTLGITDGNFGRQFLRSDVAEISNNALSATMKGSETSLKDSLIQNGAITVKTRDRSEIEAALKEMGGRFSKTSSTLDHFLWDNKDMSEALYEYFDSNVDYSYISDPYTSKAGMSYVGTRVECSHDNPNIPDTLYYSVEYFAPDRSYNCYKVYLCNGKPSYDSVYSKKNEIDAELMNMGASYLKSNNSSNGTFYFNGISKYDEVCSYLNNNTAYSWDCSTTSAVSQNKYLKTSVSCAQDDNSIIYTVHFYGKNNVIKGRTYRLLTSAPEFNHANEKKNSIDADLMGFGAEYKMVSDTLEHFYWSSPDKYDEICKYFKSNKNCTLSQKQFKGTAKAPIVGTRVECVRDNGSSKITYSIEKFTSDGQFFSTVYKVK